MISKSALSALGMSFQNLEYINTFLTFLICVEIAMIQPKYRKYTDAKKVI